MFELPSAIFLIADGNEFRFARFYIVCEEVPLGTPESPPIVSGVPDMHPSDCPNVEETRNPMQTFSRKKCSHFSPTNIPSAFPHEIPKCVSYNITYHTKVTMLIVTVSLKKASCGLPMEEPREAFSHIRYHLDRCHNSVFAVKLYISAGL